MAYFLKKTKNKKGTYLQIYESYYDPERKGGAHRSYKPIGYVHELQASGIEDPITVFGEEVQKEKTVRKRTADFWRISRKVTWLFPSEKSEWFSWM